MGWLREKFKTIESGIDTIGEKIENSIKQEHQKHNELIEKNKREWEESKWHKKGFYIIVSIGGCIFAIYLLVVSWPFLCELWFCLWYYMLGEFLETRLLIDLMNPATPTQYLV